MEKFGLKRKQELREDAEFRKKAEKAGVFLPMLRVWGKLNSSLSDFDDTFGPTLPSANENLKTYTERVFQHKRGNVVALELGGHGTKLFSGFSKGFLRRSAGVLLSDYRILSRLNRRTQAKEHSVLVGDIVKPETVETVQKWLGGDKIDIIFERMVRGLDFLPADVFSLSAILQRWYGLLSDDGMMFIELPFFPGWQRIMPRWEAMLKEKFGRVLEVQYHKFRVHGSGALRIRKLPGAPLELPFLDARTVQKATSEVH